MTHIRLTSGQVKSVNVELEHVVRRWSAALNCRVPWKIGRLTLNPFSVEEITRRPTADHVPSDVE